MNRAELRDQQPILRVDGLEVEIQTRDGVAHALNGVSFDVWANEVVGLIGETGAGKSLTVWAAIGIVDPPLRVTKGEILIDGQDVALMTRRERRRVLSQKVGLVVQNPKVSLDPMTTIGAQLVRRIHNSGAGRGLDARDRALRALTEVGLPDPVQRMRAYPHELSGGMAQRVLIALAMVTDPLILLADEPTTGLDLTIQAQILDLIRSRVQVSGSAVLLVTHDLGVVAHYCDRVAVMYSGRIVEVAPVIELFRNPQHPYTQELISAAKVAGVRPDSASSGTTLGGSPPDLVNLPSGCHYRLRCPRAETACETEPPSMVIANNHVALCHYPGATR